MDQLFFIVAGLSGALGVALGAFGAHALQGHLAADRLGTYETAIRYQMYHALALLGVAVALSRFPQTGLLLTAGWLFIAGTILFCGSLYLLVVSRARAVGAITPLGGLAFIAGWICVALAAWQG